MRVLQLSTADQAGGAEAVAWNLLHSYRARGHQAWLAVGDKRTESACVFQIQNDEHRSAWERLAIGAGDQLAPLVGKVKGAGFVRQFLSVQLGQPRRWWNQRQGREDFAYPGSWHVRDLLPEQPDVVHCHNLHGGYFDLRALASLSQQVPTVLTLHDAWLLSGHCAHSFGCDRWKAGCGDCPDLAIPPAIRRDATAENWQRKRDIYAGCRLYIATPSQWLMRRVEESMLAPAVVDARVIPNGVDLSVFHQASRSAARQALDLPCDAKVIVFAANGIWKNAWKDYETMRSAVAEVAARSGAGRLLFLALGDDAPPEDIGCAQVRFVPFVADPAVVAQYYQAADVYMHASKADTFPNTVLEALACGVPVAATSVGGISEQVRTASDSTAVSDSTGILVPVGDSRALANALDELLRNDNFRECLAENAARDASERFDLKRQTQAYLEWYQSILISRH